MSGDYPYINLVSVSGGKDSLATLLRALELVPFESIVGVTADTDHESEITYKHIEYIEKFTGVKIHKVKASFDRQIASKAEFVKNKWAKKGVSQDHIKEAIDILKPSGNAFLDLCIWKGRFPSRMAQFCTHELKIKPIQEFMDREFFTKGYFGKIYSWQGVRRDESESRKNARYLDYIPEEGITIVRPIVEWSAIQTIEYIKSKGIDPNPLYSQGLSRVGCFPCINSKKEELAQISTRYPEIIEKLRRWEHLVALASKRGGATFFAPLNGEIANIDERVRWSTTTRGGTQMSLEWASGLKGEGCESSYGLCE